MMLEIMKEIHHNVAAERGSIRAAQILLDYGADVNATNNDDTTALNWQL